MHNGAAPSLGVAQRYCSGIYRIVLSMYIGGLHVTMSPCHHVQVHLSGFRGLCYEAGFHLCFSHAEVFPHADGARSSKAGKADCQGAKEEGL